MIKVPYGQDAYSVIGKYIRDHITAIEDIIAVIKIDDITTNQLFMVDMNEENYFIWNNDWYEGENDVALIDFFPVSEAINPSAQPEIRTQMSSANLISRQAAIRKLKKMATQAYIDKLNGSAETVINCCIDVIERQIPSAQPERKTGRWIPQKGGGLCCSECGGYALDEPDGNFVHVAVPSKFCPHCGARMEGDEE